MSFSSRGLVLMLCAVAAAAQTGRRPPSKKNSEPPRAEFQLVDARAESADGKPVSDLKAADFAVSVGGEAQKVDAAWRFDTAEGAIFPPSESIPLKPDQVHRTLVFIVDDLGLTAPEAHNVREALGRFLIGSIRSTDTVSIV